MAFSNTLQLRSTDNTEIYMRSEQGMKQYSLFWGQDIKRALSEKGFILGIALLVAVFINCFRQYVRTDGSMSTWEIIIDAMALSGFGPFAAVFPALGYSSQFAQEYNSGYLKMITSRMSWKQYGKIRILSVGLSGGLIMAVPFSVLVVYAYAVGTHEVPEFVKGTVMGWYLENYGSGYVLGFKVLLGFLFGVMFSLISFAFAVWSANRYVAMIAPFILYEALWALLPLKVMFLNPIYMVRGDDLASYPLSAGMEMIYIIIAVTAVWLGMKKRAGQE